MARHTPAARRLFLRTGPGTILQREAILSAPAPRAGRTLAGPLVPATTPTPRRLATIEPVQTARRLFLTTGREREASLRPVVAMRPVADFHGSLSVEEIERRSGLMAGTADCDFDILEATGQCISTTISGAVGLDPDRTLSSQIGQAAEEGSLLAQLGDVVVRGHFREAFAEDPRRIVASTSNMLPCIPKSYAKRIAREIKRGRMTCR